MARSKTRDPKRLVLDHLKRNEAATAAQLSDLLGVTTVAVRQHLDQLEAGGLISRREARPHEKRGRGRPAAAWTLTALATELFPDRHADLTLELIKSIREVVGENGVDLVLAKRSERQRVAYAAAVSETPVAIRARSLADLRSEEGYMAEVVDEGEAGFVLVEHHCPICEAATECQGLCREELETFQYLFDGVATVERESHLLGGDRRCSYRIVPVEEDGVGELSGDGES